MALFHKVSLRYSMNEVSESSFWKTQLSQLPCKKLRFVTSEFNKVQRVIYISLERLVNKKKLSIFAVLLRKSINK